MTPYERARWCQTLGIGELPGNRNHPFIQCALMLCGFDAEVPDEIAWCSAFVNLCHRLELHQHTNSAAARSWLAVGQAVPWRDAEPGDVVILKRGGGKQPGPEVVKAPGHVGFYVGAGAKVGELLLLGGNQSNRITVAPFLEDLVLGVRRIDH